MWLADAALTLHMQTDIAIEDPLQRSKILLQRSKILLQRSKILLQGQRSEGSQ
jgi:hypothetical protein